MSKHYRIKIIYDSGREEFTGHSDKRQAEKLVAKYKALPTVKSVGLKEVGGSR